ncbi:MAG: hypothetical protein IJF80_03125 [Clostridia bacterium]|nr:hypothetical protein [Clostridia bacterium]
MARRRIRIRFQTKFYVLVAAICIIALTVLVWVLTGNNAMLEMGYVNTEIETVALIVRDEECFPVEKHDRVLYKVDEGSEVNAGDTVASVFKWGYTDERMQALITVQREILEEQRAQLAGALNSKLSELDSGIEQKIVMARENVMRGTEGDLLKIEQELDALLNERRKLLKETVQPNTRLENLYAAEEEQLALLNEWRANVTASKAGRISFYFDGYEQALNAQKLELLNSEIIASAIKNTKSVSSEKKDGTLLYRIVNPSEFYLAFSTSLDSFETIKKGVNYEIVFDSNNDTPYMAEGIMSIAETEKLVSVLKVSADIDNFIDARKVSLVARATVNGLKIPVSMIKAADGKLYICVDRGMGKEMVEINVLATDGKDVIIEAKNEADNLTAGMRCKKP